MKGLPAEVRAVMREFPGIHEPRAHQIVKERKIMRARAARQARQNLFGPVEAGGLGPRARALIDSFEGAR